MTIAEYIIGKPGWWWVSAARSFRDADDLIFSDRTEVSVKDIKEVLPVIQDFDPAGIAARNLKECLLLQLEKKEQTPVWSWRKK